MPNTPLSVLPQHGETWVSARLWGALPLCPTCSFTGAWPEMCRFDEEGWLVILRPPFALCAPTRVWFCLYHPHPPSIRSELGASSRDPTHSLKNHCPDPKWNVKVRKRKKISPWQEICLLTSQTQKSQWSFSPLNQLKCLLLMGSLKISVFSTNSLKMLKMKSNKGCRTYESLNYRAIFLRAKQNNNNN